VLTDTTGYVASNTSADPLLVNPYCNGGRALDSAPGVMLALPAVDEGGATWIDVRYGPLTQTWPAGGTHWDYHISDTSSAIDSGRPNGAPRIDFDKQPRPMGSGFDIGADEFVSTDLVGGSIAYSSGVFGNVNINEAGTVVIIATVSGAPVVFTTSSNPSAPFSKIGDTCSGSTIPIGGSCTLTISYSPTVDGVATTDLFVANNSASGSPQTVTLAGTGIIPPGTVSFASSSPFPLNASGTILDFGNLQNGDFETTVTLSASGFPESISNLALQGSGRYSISTEDNGDLCSGITLAAGENCTIIII
jgi:hypothetical protein